MVYDWHAIPLEEVVQLVGVAVSGAAVGWVEVDVPNSTGALCAMTQADVDELAQVLDKIRLWR
jgi:hypothetical protein